MEDIRALHVRVGCVHPLRPTAAETAQGQRYPQAEPS